MQRLVQARRDLHLTQQEVSDHSDVSLRTIQNLENKRSHSFNESTLIAICKALDVNVDDLLEKPQASGSEEDRRQGESGRRETDDSSNPSDEPMVKMPARTISSVVVLAVALMVIGLVVSVVSTVVVLKNYFGEPEPKQETVQRHDWVKRAPAELVDLTPSMENWDDWWGDSVGILIRKVVADQLVFPGQEIPMTVQWAWHTGAEALPVFLQVYRDWEPDQPQVVMADTLTGDGIREATFILYAPEQPGVYGVRLFYSNGETVQAYYGEPAGPGEEAPHHPPYVEFRLEVIREND